VPAYEPSSRPPRSARRTGAAPSGPTTSAPLVERGESSPSATRSAGPRWSPRYADLVASRGQRIVPPNLAWSRRISPCRVLTDQSGPVSRLPLPSEKPPPLRCRSANLCCSLAVWPPCRAAAPGPPHDPRAPGVSSSGSGQGRPASVAASMSACVLANVGVCGVAGGSGVSVVVVLGAAAVGSAVGAAPDSPPPHPATARRAATASARGTMPCALRRGDRARHSPRPRRPGSTPGLRPLPRRPGAGVNAAAAPAR